MNKLTSTIAGLALVAAATVAPAFASAGIFQPNPAVGAPLPNFTFTGSTYTLADAPVTYFSGSPAGVQTGFLTLQGTTPVVNPLSTTYNSTLLTFSSTVGGPALFTEFGSSVVSLTPTVDSFASVSAFTGIGNSGSTIDRFQLDYSPVPETSTVASFGVLLALGSLAVLRRKSVKNVS